LTARSSGRRRGSMAAYGIQDSCRAQRSPTTSRELCGRLSAPPQAAGHRASTEPWTRSLPGCAGARSGMTGSFGSSATATVSRSSASPTRSWRTTAACSRARARKQISRPQAGHARRSYPPRPRSPDTLVNTAIMVHERLTPQALMHLARDATRGSRRRCDYPFGPNRQHGGDLSRKAQ
jgi:hypothetical protein